MEEDKYSNPLEDELITRVSEVYQEYEQDQISLMPDLGVYEQIKDKIVCRLMNEEANRAYLQDKPHTQVEDLAVVYSVVFQETKGERFGFTITNKLMEQMDINLEELHKQAISNMETRQSYELKSLDEIVEEMIYGGSIDHDDLDPEDSARLMEFEKPGPDVGLPVYVLTNERRCEGAAMILSDSICQEIASWMGDFYILPSSIHETILIPKEISNDYRGLSSMVREVNESEVAPEDWLSDHVYEYDSKTHELSRCDWKAERERGKLQKPSLKEKLAERKVVSSERLLDRPEIKTKKKEELTH